MCMLAVIKIEQIKELIDGSANIAPMLYVDFDITYRIDKVFVCVGAIVRKDKKRKICGRKSTQVKKCQSNNSKGCAFPLCF